CVAAAQRRHPAAVGTVTLSITVADRALAGVVIASNDVADADLGACLVRTARTFKFSLSAAQVAWPVTLTPSAARQERVAVSRKEDRQGDTRVISGHGQQ